MFSLISTTMIRLIIINVRGFGKKDTLISNYWRIESIKFIGNFDTVGTSNCS